MSNFPSKTMYRVEKFLPSACPKCNHPFVTASSDWSVLLGDIIDGEKVVRPTNGYAIIICAHCGNYTAKFGLEEYQLSSKKDAEKLIVEQGFCNLIEVIAVGNHCQDMHIVTSQMPSTQVKAVKSSDE